MTEESGSTNRLSYGLSETVQVFKSEPQASVTVSRAVERVTKFPGKIWTNILALVTYYTK